MSVYRRAKARAAQTLTLRQAQNDTLLALIIAYQCTGSQRVWALIVETLQPVIRGYARGLAYAFGSLDDAQQAVLAGLVEAVNKYDAARESRHVISELERDVWNSTSGGGLKWQARRASLPGMLETPIDGGTGPRSMRPKMSEMSDAPINGGDYEYADESHVAPDRDDPRALLAAACDAGVLYPEELQQLLAYHLDGIDDKTLGARYGMTPVAMRVSLHRSMERVKRWLKA
jgi:hypothetical protein